MNSEAKALLRRLEQIDTCYDSLHKNGGAHSGKAIKLKEKVESLFTEEIKYLGAEYSHFKQDFIGFLKVEFERCQGWSSKAGFIKTLEENRNSYHYPRMIALTLQELGVEGYKVTSNQRYDDHLTPIQQLNPNQFQQLNPHQFFSKPQSVQEPRLKPNAIIPAPKKLGFFESYFSINFDVHLNNLKSNFNNFKSRISDYLFRK